MSTELESKIASNASSPKSAEQDGFKVEQHSLPDQIAADKYLEAKKASRKKNFGVVFKKISSPGI